MSAIASKALGSVVSIGAASAVVGYVYSQLHHESDTIDRFFQTYHTPQSEASRQRVFDGAIEDPRANVLNFLSWKKAKRVLYTDTNRQGLPQSSFVQERRAPALPSPAEIRALNEASGHCRAASLNHPPPVIIPSLGLAVKYGADVTIAEVETQVLMRERLQGRVPVPEVFGWAEDGGQKFIYMSLVEGDTLQARFSTMNEGERQAVCKELRYMVAAWRALTQEADRYIGSVGKRPLSDIFVAGQPERVGPFLGADAVQKFHDTCGIDISDDVPINFTHNDLCPPNILLSCDPNPKIVAILDWGQSGWYPSYWEYCKARRVGVVDEEFNLALQEEWHTSYLPKVIDTVDDERFYHPWLYFMLSNI